MYDKLTHIGQSYSW